MRAAAAVRLLPTLVAAWCAAPACATSDTLDAVLQLMAQRRHGEADFELLQYIASLRRPLHSSGIMIYDAPAHLEERTLEPHPQSFVLERRTLILQEGARRRTLDLEAYPQIAALIESIRATLAGDRTALEQRFEVSMQGDLQHWVLQLQPRAAQAAGFVRSLRISGDRDAIAEVEVRQSDGDYSLMKIHPRP